MFVYKKKQFYWLNKSVLTNSTVHVIGDLLSKNFVLEYVRSLKCFDKRGHDTNKVDKTDIDFNNILNNIMINTI